MTASVGTNPDSKTIPLPFLASRRLLLVEAVVPKLIYISVSDMFCIRKYCLLVLELNAVEFVLAVLEVLPLVTVTAPFLGRIGRGVPPEIPCTVKTSEDGVPAVPVVP